MRWPLRRRAADEMTLHAEPRRQPAEWATVPPLAPTAPPAVPAVAPSAAFVERILARNLGDHPSPALHLPGEQLPGRVAGIAVPRPPAPPGPRHARPPARRPAPQPGSAGELPLALPPRIAVASRSGRREGFAPDLTHAAVPPEMPPGVLESRSPDDLTEPDAPVAPPTTEGEAGPRERVRWRRVPLEHARRDGERDHARRAAEASAAASQGITASPPRTEPDRSAGAGAPGPAGTAVDAGPAKRASSAPLVQRRRPGLAAPPPHNPPAGDGSGADGGVHPVPSELRDAVRRSHGVDVSPVRVHRDDAARDESRRHGARALARGDDILLPGEHGPVDRGPARGLLAHELTHVAQQRRLGSTLPLEHSPAGRRLEREAQEAERRWSGDGTPATPEPASPPAAASPATSEAAASIQKAVAEPLDELDEEDAVELSRRVVTELTESGLATLDAAGALIFPFGGDPGEETPAPVDEMPPGGSRSSAHEPAPGPAGRAAAAARHPGAAPPGNPATAHGEHGPSSADLELSPAVLHLPAPLSSPPPPPPPSAPAPAASPAAPEGEDTADEADPDADAEETERRLYRRLRSRLRGELLVDRERAGLVTDLRRGV